MFTGVFQLTSVFNNLYLLNIKHSKIKGGQPLETKLNAVFVLFLNVLQVFFLTVEQINFKYL